MEDFDPIDEQLRTAKRKLAELEQTRAALEKEVRRLEDFRYKKMDQPLSAISQQESQITNASPEGDKITLFQSLFKGREDVFAKRFESKRSGKSGYQPVCRNEWVRPFCQKPKIKCATCDNRAFEPLTGEMVRLHLIGKDAADRYQREFVIGIYPMLSDETCWFLAVDFDKATWVEDARAYLDTCKHYDVPAVLERSRSGHGGHIWIFFFEPLPAKLARQLGSFLLTQAMAERPEMGFDSYDRFFPSQDTLPKGGFGNLIALPFQKRPRSRGNTVFVDGNIEPYSDQWAFLSSIKRVDREKVLAVVAEAFGQGGILGVRYVSTDEDDIDPWRIPPSGRIPNDEALGPIPESLDLVIGNQIYIDKGPLSPSLKNKLIRLAAFQNPDFYKAQAMRLPTYDKPRIIHCCEDFPNYIGLPRGCFDDALHLLHSLDIETRIVEERFDGKPLSTTFSGKLRPEQQSAAEALLENDTGVLSASTAFGKTVAAYQCRLIVSPPCDAILGLVYNWIPAGCSETGFLNLDRRCNGFNKIGNFLPRVFCGLNDNLSVCSFQRS